MLMISLPVHPSMIKRISVMSLFKDLQNFFHKEKQLPVTTVEPQAKAQNYPDAQPKKEVPQEEKKETPVGVTVLRQESEPQIPDSHALPQEETNVKNSSGYNIGELIDNRYKIESIMSGSMGYVYISKDTRQRITFAIKQPKNALLGDHELFARVVQEADAWTRLGMHPNIAYCYFVKAIAGVPHIFIEYVDGGSLEEWISDRRCADYQIGLDMAVQFCHGMERAHERGMIHRDIKPTNILVTQGGLVKVTDFGLVGGVKTSGSAGVEGDLHGTRMGDTMGTPAYMPPEQWNDPRQKSSEAPNGVWQESDVYSFGVCLWEMFCGRRPYELSIGVTGKPPEPRELRRDIPDTLRELLLKSVELDRKKRQKNFRELTEELNKVYQELYGSEAPSYQLELHDTTADELNNQGYSYYELGKKEEARRCFEAAVEVNNTHPEAVFNLVLLQWRGGEIDDLEALRKVRNCLNHTSAREKKISELLAYIQAERHDPASAEEELKEYQGRYEKLFGGISIRRLELIRTVEGHGESVNFVFLSADGKYAISETSGMDQDDNTPKLWDVSTGQCLRTFDWAYSSERFISLSADGRYAISASDSEVSLGLWEMSTGHLLRTFEGDSSLVQSVSLSADGKYALSGSADKTLKLWEVSTGRCLRTFVGHSGDAYSVCLSTDGKYALSGSGDNTLKLWEVSTGLCLRTFVGHIGWVVSVSLSADGKYALSRSEDNTLKLWEVSTGRCLRTIEGWWYRDYACSVILSADGRYAILGGGDKKLMLWEININSHSYNSELKVSDFKAFDEIKGVQDELKYAIEEAGRLMNNGNNTKAFTTLYNAWEKDDFRDRTELLTVYQKLYQLSSIKSFSFAYKINSFEGHSRTVNSVSLSADGRYALSGSMDKTLKLWDVSTGLCLRTFEGHSGDVNSVCLSTNGKYALSGSADKTLKLWDVSTGLCLRTFEGHSGDVNSVCLSTNGKYALSGSADKTLKLWDVLTGRCLGTFVNSWWDGGNVNSVCLIANGKSALSGSTDKTLKLWDMSTSQCLRTFQGHSSTVTSVSLSADERYALSGSDDKTLKLWDVSTGQCLRTFEGRGYVCSVCLSADGRYALSGSRDNTLKLWETETGECVHNFEGHTNSVYSVALSADGKYALSGSSDDTIKLFRLIWKLEFDE